MRVAGEVVGGVGQVGAQFLRRKNDAVRRAHAHEDLRQRRRGADQGEAGVEDDSADRLGLRQPGGDTRQAWIEFTRHNTPPASPR
jgi:hypothetical protein